MAELKTKKNAASVKRFIDAIPDERKREDSRVLLQVMKKATGKQPRMWGASIVGFGEYHYKYESGREGDWFVTGFSPRKQDLTLYIMAGFAGQTDLMKKLGRHKIGKSCLYIKRLSDVDSGVLEKMIRRGVEQIGKLRGR